MSVLLPTLEAGYHVCMYHVSGVSCREVTEITKETSYLNLGYTVTFYLVMTHFIVLIGLISFAALLWRDVNYQLNILTRTN